jgi:hypothetical protein
MRGLSPKTTKRLLVQNFHLPLYKAAMKLGVCTSALKKACRRVGISRWPYRSLQRIETMIRKKASQAEFSDLDARTHIFKEIEQLERKKISFIERASQSAQSSTLSPATLLSVSVYETASSLSLLSSSLPMQRQVQIRPKPDFHNMVNKFTLQTPPSPPSVSTTRSPPPLPDWFHEDKKLYQCITK